MPRKSGLEFALGSPKRLRICKAVAEAGSSSPRELSDELGIGLGNIAYHVRVLADNGALRLVEEQPTRGTIKHVYELDISEPWALARIGVKDDDGGAMPPSE